MSGAYVNKAGLSRDLKCSGLCRAEDHLGIAVWGQVELLWEGDWAIDLAQAAAEVLLEALQVQRQHLWGPAHAHQLLKPFDWHETC